MNQSFLNRHFREFVELLERKGVKYLLVGGYAVGFHGFPRYTGDLDVFIAIDPENANKILEVFEAFGFSDLKLTTNDFLEDDMVVEIGREPLKIQILTGIDGIQFDDAYIRKVYWTDQDLSIPFIGFEDLLKNKESTGRGRDKIDVQELMKNRKQKL